MTLPTGAFGNVLTAFAGTMSAADQASLWSGFKALNGLAVNPDDTDLTALTKFVSYVEGQTAGTLTQLSPEEIKKRLVLSGTFKALIALMMQFGQNLQVGSNLVQFYQQWQAQYTDQMALTPLYAPNPVNTPTINLTDLTKYTLGYDNLSFQDIVNGLSNSVSNN